MALRKYIDLKQPVLVLEDEANIAMEIKSALNDLGFMSVTTCLTMEDANRQALMSDFGLAVIDLNINGVLSFAAIDRALASDMAVVTTSGYLSEQDDLSETAFLPKPVRPGALSGAILQAFKKARARGVQFDPSDPTAGPARQMAQG